MSGLRAEQIVATAAALFAQRGYAPVSVADIIGALDCAPPQLYRRFPSKLAVLHAVFERALEQLGSSESDLDALIDTGMSIASSHPDLLVTYVRERRRIDPNQFPAIAEAHGDYVRRWIDAIRAAAPDIDRDAAAIRHRSIGGVLAAVAASPRARRCLNVRPAFPPALHELVAARSVGHGTPRLRERLWSPVAARRSEIVDAAIDLFSIRGYDQARLSDVGEVVGIAGQSIYEHFPTKHDILVAAFDRASLEIAMSTAIAIEESSSAGQALDRLASGLAQATSRHRQLFTVTNHEFGALSPADRDRFAARRSDIDDQWAGVLLAIWPDLQADHARIVARAGIEAILHGSRGHASDALSAPDLAAVGLAFVRSAAAAMASASRDAQSAAAG